MDITRTFFSPNGRLQTQDFYRAIIVLVGLFLVSNIIQTFAAAGLAMMFSILSFVFLYCYFCVFAKRLHDSRRTGWFFLLFLLGYLVISTIISAILTPILAPAAMELAREQGELLGSGTLDLNDVMAYAQEISKKSFLPATLTLLATNATLAYIAGNLRSDPRDNEYGPAPSGSAADQF